jgi:hypothetical protein
MVILFTAIMEVEVEVVVVVHLQADGLIALIYVVFVDKNHHPTFPLYLFLSLILTSNLPLPSTKVRSDHNWQQIIISLTKLLS